MEVATRAPPYRLARLSARARSGSQTTTILALGIAARISAWVAAIQPAPTRATRPGPDLGVGSGFEGALKVCGFSCWVELAC